MRLFYTPGACSLAPHIIAREAGISISLVHVDLSTKRTNLGEDFLKINPKGYVPTLELESGEILTEVPVILQYIADIKPELGLVPACGTLDRYRLQEVLGFINSEIHKSYSPLFSPTIAPEVAAERKQLLIRRYAIIDNMLKARSWLSGDAFSPADAYLYTVTNWAKVVGLDLSSYRTVLEFQKRVRSRPSVQAALKLEGLTP